MAFVTKKVDLDGAGAGTVHVPPSWYVGAQIPGVGVVVNDGDTELGTALLTRANSQFVVGDLVVTGGTPSESGVIYLEQT